MKKEVNLLILYILGIFLLIVGTSLIIIGNPSISGIEYSTGDISRDFSQNSINNGEILAVNLNVIITGNPEYYIIDEIIPEDFDIIDSNEGDTSEKNHIKWVNTIDTGSKTYTYQLKASQETNSQQTYFFNGTYLIQGMNINQISGKKEISITAGSTSSSSSSSGGGSSGGGGGLELVGKAVSDITSRIYDDFKEIITGKESSKDSSEKTNSTLNKMITGFATYNKDNLKVNIIMLVGFIIIVSSCVIIYRMISNKH